MKVTHVCFFLRKGGDSSSESTAQQLYITTFKKNAVSLAFLGLAGTFLIVATVILLVGDRSVSTRFCNESTGQIDESTG